MPPFRFVLVRANFARVVEVNKSDMKSPSTSLKELRQDVITPVAKRERALASNLLLSADSFSPTSSGVLFSSKPGNAL